MLKLQQFWILKFNSDRLRKAEYNINITLDEARQNSEVITINNSEMIKKLAVLYNRVGKIREAMKMESLARSL